MAAALQYLESERKARPELADWYNALADLYQKKLWHQLALKLDQFFHLRRRPGQQVLLSRVLVALIVNVVELGI